MKNILRILILTIFASVCGCNRVFHYTNDKPEDATDSIIFDSSTQMFVRKLYLDKNNNKTKDSITDNNKTKDSIAENNILIEVQFLIFNQKDQVIYIATTPSKKIYDKGETYLIYHDIFPNSYFLNTFYFGRVFSENDSKKRVVFHNRKLVQIWNFDKIANDKSDKKSQPKLKLTMIDNHRLKNVEMQNNNKYTKPVYLSTENVNLSSNHDFELTKIRKFKYLSFKIPVKKMIQDQKKDTNKKEEPSPQGKGIFFKYSDDNLNYLYIPFNQTIKDNYTTIKFKSSRVRFKRDTSDSIPYRNSIE